MGLFAKAKQKRKKKKKKRKKKRKLKKQRYKKGTIYQPLRSGRIWHKVNF